MFIKEIKIFRTYLLLVEDTLCAPSIAILLMLMLFPPTLALAEGAEQRPPASSRTLAFGEHQYRMRCARCHGAKGDGNGQEADFYDPRPRDFTLGMFKFRTTSTGALPTDSDLFLTISRGISGTAMPSWEGLPEQMRWALVDYIKTFADDFSDLELDPSKFVVTLPPKVASSAESIAKGKALFEKNKCWECHGKEARGDGRTNLKDDWDFPTRVPNLTRIWNLKGGSDAKDIVYRFTTGLNGSAMPSFEDSIEGNDRWHLANYVASIAKTGFNRERIIKAEWTEKTIPLKVDDEIWRGLEATQIFMENQTMATPRWINRAIDMLELKVLYNRDKIAFLIEWDDPVQDLLHDKAQEVRTFRDQYARAAGEMPREPGVFRDAIALQFPVSSTLGKKMPPFLGSTDNPVNQWLWKSDLLTVKDASVEEGVAKGFMTPIHVQADHEQQARSEASWKNGRWHLLIIRALTTPDKADVQFKPDQIIPIAFSGWDGSNGEHGKIMGVSPWHLLHLSPPDSDLFDRLNRMAWFFGISGEHTP